MTDEAADVLRVAPPVVAEERLRALLQHAWNLTPRRLQRLGSERDVNVLVDGEFVLKVSNPAEDPAVVDMEVAAMAHLAVAEPDLVIPATVPAVDGASVRPFADETGRSLSGPADHRRSRFAAGGRADHHRPRRAGRRAGRAGSDRAGRFFHPAAGRVLDWDVRRAAEVVRADHDRSRPAGARDPDRTGARGRRHVARRRAACRCHADQCAGRGRSGHRPGRLRRHAPHGRRLRPRRHPHLGPPQYRRRADRPTPGVSPPPCCAAISGTGR